MHNLGILTARIFLLIRFSGHKKNPEQEVLTFILRVSILQEKGLEPSLCCHNRHLKPARLPIPPLLHTPFPVLMRKMGLEPTRCTQHKILSLARLPIPTLPHVGFVFSQSQRKNYIQSPNLCQHHF